MNQTSAIIIGLVLILGVGGLVFWQKQEAAEEQGALQAAQEAQRQMPGTSAGSETTNPGGTTTDGAGEETGSTASAYTAADVAAHSSRSSCWSTINGSVYDLTSWIPKHPGGEGAILQLCGKDGSAKFNAQHGGAALQAQILAGFKIGVAK